MAGRIFGAMRDTHDETTAEIEGHSASVLFGTAPAWFFARPPFLQFAFWFLVVLALKHASLLEPPVWDSAMGIFPPAIYLYETNFDIRSLLQQGNWWEGGPNVHSLSLLTWIIAAVMKLTDSPQTTFAVVHLLTFGVFAWTLLLFSRVLRSYGLAAPTVLAAASFLLLMPVVLVQAGYMYTDSLVMAASVAAWSYWREDRHGLAILVCVIGLFVKLTAIAIAASVFVVVLLSAWPLRKRTIVTIAAIPAALLVNRSLASWLGASPRPQSSWGTPQALMASLVDRLQAVPDLMWLFVGALLSSVLYALLRIRRDRGLDFLSRNDPDSRSRLICLAMPLALSAGVVAMVYDNVLFLPRYLLPAVPFAIGSILLLAAAIRAERVAFVLLVGACLLSATNYRGRFYAPNYSSFSVVERSHAYRDFHAVQVEAIRLLATKPVGIPAFVSREIDYMTSHRMMGYVEEPVANIHPIYQPPHRQRALNQFPEEFFLVQTNIGHGGGEMNRLVETARASDAYSVSPWMFDRAGFHARFYWVRRVGE